MQKKKVTDEKIIKGIPASPGVAIGKVFVLDKEDLAVSKRKIYDKDLKDEMSRFKEAMIKTKKEILGIKKKISVELGTEHGEIFSAHLLVLEDTLLIEEVISRLKKEKCNIEYIFFDVLKNYIRAFSKMDDEYIRERLSDISDVGKRILRNLLGTSGRTLSTIKEKVIIIAYDLSPSDTATMHRRNVIGFATDIGGRTSHTAIMAKSLEIPAVVGLETVTREIEQGDTIIIDGIEGKVIIRPEAETIEKYKTLRIAFEKFESDLSKLRDLPCQTLDGHKIELAANIELPEEIPSVIAHGAEGIGLYRTEYFYMNRRDLPSEEEQFHAYKNVAEQLAPRPVIIRTLDLGGDKFLSQLEIPREMNPYLGWRAIRFCLARPDVFKIQLRAILRASVFGNLKMMYPMISGVEELRQANAVLKSVMAELKKKKIKFNKDMEVGAMIEIPSAALTSDILAKEVDFFSIGTNDLIQYALAVDRSNEKIAYLYEPAHPAVLKLIKNVIDSGHKEKIWVGMCGEMAGEVPLTIILLGLGLDEFSTSPISMPEVKRIVRSIKLSRAKEVAAKALTLSTAKDVKKLANEEMKALKLT